MGICASQLSTAAHWAASAPSSFGRLYEVDEKAVLAERPFAVIYRGKQRASGEPVAIKRIQKLHPDAQQQTHANGSGRARRSTHWESEVAIVKQLSSRRHPNVIEFKHVFETKREALVVMEFVAGGELFDALISDGAYSEWDAKRIVRDTLEALAFLHERRIIHRDIKPENLLFTSRDSKAASIKVVNFAMATLVSQDAGATNNQLTWPYCAPEILATIGGFARIIESFRRRKSSLTSEQASGDPSCSNAIINDGSPPTSLPQTSSDTPAAVQIGAKCDLWSVGIVLYVLLSGTHPFDLDGRQTKDQIVQNILSGDFAMRDDSRIWSAISREAKSLLRMLLEVDPEKRPSAAEALEHEWFASPHTPRQPLSVSVSDGLGQYQRLMRKKFRTSVLVAMAAETFRRSLKKQKEEAGALPGNVDASPPSSDANAAPLDSPQQVTSEENPEVVPSTTLGTQDAEAVRPVEIASGTADEAEVALRKQGSVMGRVFQRQPSDEKGDESSAIDSSGIRFEDKSDFDLSSQSS